MQKYRRFRFGVIVWGVLTGLAGIAQAVSQVPRQHNFMEISFGSGSPLGSYDEVGTSISILDQDGFPMEMEGDEIFANAFHLGFTLGVMQKNLQYSLSFEYTDMNFENSFERLLTQDDPFYAIPSLSQFDLAADINAYAAQMPVSPFSPYLGLGIALGLTVDQADGFETESRINVALKGNFGVEFKIADFGKGQFLTLASANSYDLAATENRPRFLTIGGFVRLYGRP